MLQQTGGVYTVCEIYVYRVTVITSGAVATAGNKPHTTPSNSSMGQAGISMTCLQSVIVGWKMADGN